MPKNLMYPPDSRVRHYVIPAHHMMVVLRGEIKVVGLPADAQVYDVRDAGSEYRAMLLLVHSSSFSEVAEGNCIPKHELEFEVKK